MKQKNLDLFVSWFCFIGSLICPFLTWLYYVKNYHWWGIVAFVVNGVAIVITFFLLILRIKERTSQKQ